MKPFDLQRAIAGDPIVTREGLAVTEFHRLKTARTSRPCVAVIQNDAITWVGEDGKHYDSRFDLFMAPQKKTVFVNLHRSYLGDTCGKIARWFATADEAQRESNTVEPPIAIAVPVEIEI